MTSSSSVDFIPSSFNSGEFYKVVRLKTGENIWCTTRTNTKSVASEPYLVMMLPLLASPVTELRQPNDPSVLFERWAVRPWMGMSSSEEFVIGTEIILTIGDMKSAAIEQYKEYLLKISIVEKAQQVVLEQRKQDQEQRERDAAIRALLLPLSKTGEVTFIDKE